MKFPQRDLVVAMSVCSIVAMPDFISAVTVSGQCAR